LAAFPSSTPHVREPHADSLWMDCNIAPSLVLRLAGRTANAAARGARTACTGGHRAVLRWRGAAATGAGRRPPARRGLGRRHGPARQ